LSSTNRTNPTAHPAAHNPDAGHRALPESDQWQSDAPTCMGGEPLHPAHAALVPVLDAFATETMTRAISATLLGDADAFLLARRRVEVILLAAASILAESGAQDDRLMELFSDWQLTHQSMVDAEVSMNRPAGPSPALMVTLAMDTEVTR
jgi:hypothetical protein